jgi:hypothetical protein
MQRLGKKKGRRKLHEYKVEAGGHATTTGAKKARRRK